MASPTPITDPQSHDSYGSADPNANAVENAPVAGDTNQDNARILARQTPSGISRGVQQLGGPSLQADSGNKQITVTDTVPQVLMGSQPTFGEGFYVTKPGIDATSTKKASDFIFNSNQNVFKIVDFVSTSITIPALGASAVGLYLANSEVTIPHGLDFAPFILGAEGDGFGFLPFPIINTSLAGGTGGPPAKFTNLRQDFIFASVDETNVTIFGNRILTIMIAAGLFNYSATSYSISYYLLQETAG